MRFIGILDKVSPLNNMEIIMGFGFRSIFGRHQDNLEYHDRRNDDRIKLPKIATILIVDDSRTAIAVLRKTLEPTGYTVLSALNAEEGIEIAKNDKPDCILMDIIMPGLNGFQATRILRKEPLTQHIPILIISGNEQATEKYWGLRVGANGFLGKPVDRSELFHLLGEHLPEVQVI